MHKFSVAPMLDWTDRDFTLTGILLAWRIASTHCATSSGGCIKHAPKLPVCTLFDGQPSLMSEGCCSRDRMVVGFTTTCAISADHH
jgi:hypothetical protein